MRLIVDTHFFLWSTGLVPGLTAKRAALLKRADQELWLSVVALWEIRLKADSGRLTLSGALEQGVELFLGEGSGLIRVTRAHMLTRLADPPATRDPFDRLLLAQCECEGMKLLTVDRSLRGHRLAAPL